jgi:transcriptional regulator with XRE-family HTH domain
MYINANFSRLMYLMVIIKEVSFTLAELGIRLRDLRIARGESQELFASRIGVSRPTVKAIEKGEATVQVGHWMAACWALNCLGDVRESFIGAVPLLDLPSPSRSPRVRAGRRIVP